MTKHTNVFVTRKTKTIKQMILTRSTLWFMVWLKCKMRGTRSGGHRRAGHLCMKNFSTAPEKTDTLNCFAWLTPPSIISKNPGFWALYLAQQNEFGFFRFINTKTFFSFLAAGFCPKNLAFARKIMVLPESGGLLACTPMVGTVWSADQPIKILDSQRSTYWTTVQS